MNRNFRFTVAVFAITLNGKEEIGLWSQITLHSAFHVGMPISLCVFGGFDLKLTGWRIAHRGQPRAMRTIGIYHLYIDRKGD